MSHDRPMPAAAEFGEADVLTFEGADGATRLCAVTKLFDAYGLQVTELAPGAVIPGSFWGAPEAGLVGDRLYLRRDTPLHSALHEGCHFLCMDGARRDGLDRDAGGDDLEEMGVCYLQIVLAVQLGVPPARAFADMDAWGYSFRLGSAQAWFETDAEDALAFLQRHGLLDPAGRSTGARRC